MLAIIPSIGRSPRLTELVRTLLDDGVTVYVVDNLKDGSAPSKPLIEGFTDKPGFHYLVRPEQNIYKTWNYGLDRGKQLGHECVLVLNDDIVIEPGAAKRIEPILKFSGFAIVSFFDEGLPNQVLLKPKDAACKLVDTTIPAAAGKAHGLCSYAFAANPAICARADERFIWYCGDPDLFYTTAKFHGKIGIAHTVKVKHLEDGSMCGTPAEVTDKILPPGWHEHDIALLQEKWGPEAATGWVPAPPSDSKPLLFIGIPSHSGKLSVELHRWVAAVQALAMMDKTPFNVQIAVLTGVSPVQYARNVLMGLAAQTPAARILLIDDDMIPDDTTLRIVFSEADICVARMYRFRHSGPDAFQASKTALAEIAACATYVKTLPDGTEDRQDIIPNLGIENPQEIKVDAAGTGCMMIKRCILDDPRMHVGPPDEDGTPAIFRMVQTATGKTTDWEDVDFSLRATRLGYYVAADFGARCGHRKAINLDAVAEMLYAKDKQIMELAEKLQQYIPLKTMDDILRGGNDGRLDHVSVHSQSAEG